MQMSRRSALGLLLASVTKLPLEIDAVSQFLKPKANESEIAEWLLKEYRDDLNLQGIESELERTWDELGLDFLDFAELCMHGQDELGISDPTYFDCSRIETGKDIVTAFTYLQEAPDIPLGIFEAESHLDVRDLIQTNCRKAIRVIAADPDEQLTLMGNVYCPGCNLTSYYAEWLRRAIAHPRMHRVEGFDRVRDLVAAIDQIPRDEKACTFEGKAERLYLKGWAGARDAAREAMGVY
jgi:acyl carrier protein